MICAMVGRELCQFGATLTDWRSRAPALACYIPSLLQVRTCFYLGRIVPEFGLALLVRIPLDQSERTLVVVLGTSCLY